MKDSRRDFLKKAALLSGAFAAPHLVPMSIQKAMAIDPAQGSTFYDAEHVVFLMQENRSFDHMFGKLRGVRGFNDPRAKTLPNKNKVWLQQDKGGLTHAPFHVDIHQTRISWQGGLPHSWKDQTEARNQGKYDNWLPIKSNMALAYYQREDIPFYYAFADAFTICDHHFCSSLTGTTPNRLFHFTGNVRPRLDDKSDAVVLNEQADSTINTYVDWKTVPELLEDHGISWKVYQNEIYTARLKGDGVDDWLGNYGDNPLEYISRHQVKLSAYFRENGDQTVDPPLTAMQVQARYNALSQREKNLIDKAFATNIAHEDYLTLAPFAFTNEKGEKETVTIPKGDIFAQFRKDVSENKLPKVSWLVAPQKFSDHTSTPLYGTWYVSEALDILTANPEVWKKTIFILTYDENDGYFDHIPPFVSPDPYDKNTGKVGESIDVRPDFEQKSGNPIGLGYRVPMIIASPWSKGGFVNSEVFDHTSTVRFLETWLRRKEKIDFKCDLISSYRRAICGDLSSAFRPYNGGDVPLPKKLIRENVVVNLQNARHQPPQEGPVSLSTEDIHKINAKLPFEEGASIHFAMQEKGTRNACALPYVLAADAFLNEDQQQVSLQFETKAHALNSELIGRGAPFSVYTPGIYQNDKGKCWDFALNRGDVLTYDWRIGDFDNGVYDLHVHGPNGFFRKFKGDQKCPPIDIKLHEGPTGLFKRAGGNLYLDLSNRSSEELTIYLDNSRYLNDKQTLTLKAYGKTTVRVKVNQDHHWYDFNLRIRNHPNFYWQYAGHLETGKISVSDPYMGGELV